MELYSSALMSRHVHFDRYVSECIKKAIHFPFYIFLYAAECIGMYESRKKASVLEHQPIYFLLFSSSFHIFQSSSHILKYIAFYGSCHPPISYIFPILLSHHHHHHHHCHIYRTRMKIIVRICGGAPHLQFHTILIS